MSIGIVSDEEFEREISSDSIRSAAEIREHQLGRGAQRENILPEVRAVISEIAITSGNGAAKAAFDISQSSVSAYKNGATSTTTYNRPNEQLKKHTDEVRAKIGSIAKSKLLKALSHITNESLKETKPRDLASIAKDMSVIVNNMEPAQPANQTNAQFIFHSYPNKKEDEYDIIDVVDVK